MKSAVKVTVDLKANKITAVETVNVPDDTQTASTKLNNVVTALIVTDDPERIVKLVQEVRERHERGVLANQDEFIAAWKILKPLDLHWAIYSNRFSVIDSMRIIAVAEWWRNHVKDVAFTLVPELGFKLSWGKKDTVTGF